MNVTWQWRTDIMNYNSPNQTDATDGEKSSIYISSLL
jgi:hypothetical protein